MASFYWPKTCLLRRCSQFGMLPHSGHYILSYGPLTTGASTGQQLHGSVSTGRGVDPYGTGGHVPPIFMKRGRPW